MRRSNTIRILLTLIAIAIGLTYVIGKYAEAFRRAGAPAPWGWMAMPYALWFGGLTLAGVVIMLALLWAWCKSSRLPAGQCQKCGYNLTGNVSGVCPECGKQTGLA